MGAISWLHFLVHFKFRDSIVTLFLNTNGVLSNFDINNGPEAIENDNSIPLQTMSASQTSRMQLPVLELNDVQNQIPVRRSERLKSKQMLVHLTNNVPNSYFEAKNSANWQN
ncbi:hypothetical protein TNCV_1518771 [Trichonephila clavipes]|nr:hypothetical protein TNCV_1518771 [Trichonephila clavipes]